MFVVCCSVTQSRPTLFDPMDCSIPSFPVLHYLLEFSQTHVLWVSDAIQTFHSLSPSSPFALNLSQHQDLFQWVSCSHHEAKVLKCPPQHQSFQWIFRVNFLCRIFPFQGLITLQSKGLSRVFSTTIWKQQLFVIQPSLWSNSHIRTWLLEKP